MKIIFATNNDHKLKEIKHILGGSFDLVSLDNINFTEDIPEDEPTLEGNALFKAKFIHSITGMNVFADDTGLEIDSLGGKPGVKSARFAGESKDSNANIDKVLSLLEDIKNRQARFRTVIALVYMGREYLFEGIVKGEITGERKGSNGFGYDAVFAPEGQTRTFAEMDLDEKNTISHRSRAFEKLREFLSSQA